MLNYPLLAYATKFKTLSKEEEAKLFQDLQAGDQKAREKIYNHNLLLIFHLIKKRNIYLTNYQDLEDLITTLAFHLWEIIPKFKPEKNYRFNTFAMFCLHNKANTFLSKVTRYKERTVLTGKVEDYIIASYQDKQYAIASYRSSENGVIKEFTVGVSSSYTKPKETYTPVDNSSDE